MGIGSAERLPSSQCGRCGHWLLDVPSMCPECGSHQDESAIVLLGWAGFPIQDSRLAKPGIWVFGFMLVMVPWVNVLMGRTIATNIWSGAIGSLLAVALLVSYSLKRHASLSPQTIRVILKHEGVAQERVFQEHIVHTAVDWLLFTGWLIMAQWGPDIAQRSARPFLAIVFLLIAAIGLMHRHRTGPRIPTPWSKCTSVQLRRTAPGRASLKITRSKWHMRHPVDADLDLDDQQLAWLEQRIAEMRDTAHPIPVRRPTRD